MYWTLTVLFGLAWIIGLAASYTMGGLIHVLAVLAVVLGFVAASKSRAEEAKRLTATKHHDDHSGRKSYHVGGNR